MKILLLLLISTFSIHSFASCPDQLWSNYKWASSPVMNKEIKSCIISSDAFQESLKGLLCKGTQGSISDEYSIYLDYKSQFDLKIKERDAAESDHQKRILNSDIRSIENEWLVFGFKYEIQSELFLAFKEERRCFTEHKN